MTYAATERPAPRRPEVLEHEVALLRRLLAVRERECAELRTALVAERVAGAQTRDDLEHALAAMMDATRELEALVAMQEVTRAGGSGAGGLRPGSRSEGPEREPAGGETRNQGGFAPPAPTRGCAA